jgi:hypothetical protein
MKPAKQVFGALIAKSFTLLSAIFQEQKAFPLIYRLDASSGAKAGRLREKFGAVRKNTN